jgi:hypothetical protein
MKFGALLKLGETEKALELGKHLTQKVFGDHPNYYNNLAWTIVDPTVKLTRFGLSRRWRSSPEKAGDLDAEAR